MGGALELRTWAKRGTLVVDGPDRKTWLNGLLTCDVGDLQDGEGTWGLLLNRKGKIQSVLWVVCHKQELWLTPSEGTTEHVLGELDKRLIMEDAEVARRDVFSWLTLHGACALEAGRALAVQHNGCSARLSWLADDCAMVCLLTEDAQRVTELCSAGQLSLCGSMVSPLTDEQWVSLRLRSGLGEFGLDFDASSRPHEAGLERRAVSWSKGCYLGQEVVCMQDMRGKVKARVSVFEATPPGQAALSDSHAPGVGDTVEDPSGQGLGTVTSAGIVDDSVYLMACVATKALAADPPELSVATQGVPWTLRPVALPSEIANA